MNRRHVLRGLVAGVPLFAGCNALSGGGGSNQSNNNTTAAATTGNAATAATTMAETVRETATQTATAPSSETATPSATPTATATRTAIQPPTSATTPPSTATVAARTGRPTGQTTMGGAIPPITTTGAALDLSPLTTYTSDSYPYSVKHPAGWMADTSDPTQVTFEPDSALAQEQVLVSEGMEGISLDTLVSLLNDSFSREFNGYRVLNRRNITLSNGNRAAVLDVNITDSSFRGLVLRGKSVYTIAGGTAYGVLVFVLKGSYTSSVEQAMTAIVESLTVSGRVTSRPV